MKRTNQKSMFATLEHSWDKVELIFKLRNLRTISIICGDFSMRFGKNLRR